MNTFSLINANDYTIHKYPAYAPVTWTLESSSLGIQITDPLDLEGAVTINEAIKDSDEVNVDTGIIKKVLYKSIKHIFYSDYSLFSSQSRDVTSSIISNNENFYVVSVGQNFYGEEIKKGSFELEINSIAEKVTDDSYGNLVVSSSGTGYYVGNIFYEKGIAVIATDTSSVSAAVNQNGIKISGSSVINLVYRSNLEIERHQINIKLAPNEFNFSPFNPSILRNYTASSAATQSLDEKNVPRSGENSWSVYKLMSFEEIKPYVTTIGLYNDRYELLAIAKLSQPIQRTFATDQIFIVRFDVE